MGKLTTTKIRALKEPGRYQDGDGLMLNLVAPGRGSWVLRMQVAGKRRDFGLGSLVNVGLADARESASAIRRQFAAGLDPVVERKKLHRVIPSFRGASETMHEEHSKTWRNGKHSAQWLKTLETYAWPEIGALSVDKIDAPMVRDLLLPIWLAKPETARRVRQRVLAVLDWSVSRGFRSGELTSKAVSKGLPKQPRKDRHHAALPYREVPDFYARLVAKPGMGALALRAAILTGCRSGEVREAKWSEVNLKEGVWNIPAERMKAGRPHAVPLSKAAVDVFRAAEALKIAGTDLVFFGQNPKRPLSDMTLLKVCRDLGIAAVPHGFRSSFIDWAAECQPRTPREVREAVLAHTVAENRTEGSYLRATFFEPRTKLMEAWGSYVTTPRNAKVLEFTDRRSA